MKHTSLDECSKRNKRKLTTKESEQPSKKRKTNDRIESIKNDKESSVPPIPQTIARIEFRVGEVVWAKIKGSPHWPAKILTLHSNRRAEVVWFNDYRKTKIYQTQLFKFLIHFDEFAKKFNDTVGLKTAAQEGLMYLGSTMLR